MSAKQRTTSHVQSESTIHERTPEESRELFDRMARDYLNMSGDEFLRRWDAGEYAEGRQEPRVETMAILLPLVRDLR